MVTAPALCPRDGSRLDGTRGEYPSCIHCGYEDYTYVPPRRTGPRTPRDVRKLRYRGPHAAMTEIILEISLLVPGDRHVFYRVSCPFCGSPLVEKETSYSRVDIRLTRYKCPDGHVIHIGFQGTDEWWS